MNHRAAALRLSELVMDLTDPNTPKYRKEQIEIMARKAAINYMSKKYISKEGVSRSA